MGYTALLFCPEEKTARTVTQILGELEFHVESCTEPFAAVKKLMGQHFDAVVVDCDNEQNATLLFKSARNSASNQTSLAVAVVEGQAGVAKAFRIGANLVLTKPINIEQTKGTLRVARGLLRKGDPAKTATAAAPAADPSTPIAAAPTAKPALNPASTPKPATPSTISATRPLTPPMPPASSPWPTKATVASSTTASQDDDVLEIDVKAPVATTSAPAAMANPALNAGLPLMLGSGAASAPAPAREDQSRSAQVSLDIKATPGNVSDKAAKGSAESTSSTEATSALTFGGTNVPAESSSGHKKILIGVAAAAVIAVGLYFGWTQFKGHASTPVSSEKPVNTAPAVIPTAKKPSAAPPATTLTATTPTPSESLAISQPAAAPTKNPAADDTDADAGESTPASTSSSAKSSISTPSSGDKAGAAAKSAAAPLVVKGGAAPAIHSKTEASADTPAPSMIGLATPGSDAPPDLVGDTGNAPQPVLQTLNISQGVSQGLLIKKVQPAYPKMALTMRIEGTVELMTTISKTGDITHVKVLSGDPQLTKAAVDAVKQWKYKPYLLNGEPVEIQTQITINFKLPS